MDEQKQLIALTALNKMFRGRYFSICTIDSVAEMLGVNPAGEAYRMLCPLHCVHWDEMPAQVRQQVPDLIREYLGVGPAFQFETLRHEVIEVAPAEPRRGFLRLLSRG